MPSYRPLNGSGTPRGRPWLARRKRLYRDYTLGYFATEEEAAAAEAEFDQEWPGITPGRRRKAGG